MTKLPAKLFILYCLLISLFIFLTGLIASKNTAGTVSALIFLPVVLYFGLQLFSSTHKTQAKWIHVLISVIILLALAGISLINITRQPHETISKDSSQPIIYHGQQEKQK